MRKEAYITLAEVGIKHIITDKYICYYNSNRGRLDRILWTLRATILRSLGRR